MEYGKHIQAQRFLLAAEDATYVMEAGAEISSIEVAVGFLSAGTEALAGDALASEPGLPDASTVFVPGNDACEVGSGETVENSEGDCIDALTCPTPDPSNNPLIGDSEIECGGNGTLLFAKCMHRAKASTQQACVCGVSTCSYLCRILRARCRSSRVCTVCEWGVLTVQQARKRWVAA